MLEASLSALTPEKVDHLYGIDRARPSEHPIVVVLIGAPGVGKSSGHAAAIASGLLPADDYATINLDTLLESLEPFRAASAMAYYLKHRPDTREATQFSSIFAYGTRKENLGMFKWYNTARNAIAPVVGSETLTTLNTIRERFRPLAEKEAAKKLTELNEEAIHRAIQKQVNMVYETTLSVAKNGRVAKIDDLMVAVQGTPYRVAFLHIRGDPTETATRLLARQEFGMPYEEFPFYRVVAATPEETMRLIEKTADGFRAVSRAYSGKAEFRELPNPLDPTRLPPPREFNAAGYLTKLQATYGSSR